MTDLVFIVCRDTYTNISKEREKTMTSNLSHYVELAMKGDRDLRGKLRRGFRQ